MRRLIAVLGLLLVFAVRDDARMDVARAQPSAVPARTNPAHAASAQTSQTQTSAPTGSAQPAPQEPPPFEPWLQELIDEAKGRGFSQSLITDALVGLEPGMRVLQSDRSQAELNPGFGRYLETRLTRATTTRGKELAKTHSALLTRIEQKFGVQRRFVLAIWGLESRFGRIQGRVPIFQALATLAWDPRRAAFFRGELFNALMMVDRGYIDVKSMTGSWAGAMGQSQFMPSSYLTHAVDFDGDGHRDIWQSVPDTLASIANYLKGHGWNDEHTWGREVRLSADVKEKAAALPRRTEGCFARRNMTERRPLAEWQALGVRNRDGSALPEADVQAGLVDVGERQFLVYPNYDAILGYNCAHYYALTVALVGDSLR